MNKVRRTALVAVFLVGAAIFGAMSLKWLGGIPLGQKAARRSEVGHRPMGAAPILAAQDGPAASAVEIRYFTRDGQSNLYLQRDGRWINFTRFDQPQNVFAYAAGGDGRWAYCWHQDRGPRQLSIYDLRSLARVGHIVPGFGGTLKWTEQGTIFHHWGAGTNVSGFAVYDVRGRRALAGGASGLELSPTGRFLATFPTTRAAREPVAVYDLVTGEALFSSAGKYDVGEVLGNVWAGPRALRVRYRDAAGGEKTFSVELR